MTLKQMQAALAFLLAVEDESRRRSGGLADDEPSGPPEDAPATERPQALPAGTIDPTSTPQASPTVTA